ncbi:sensor histidine kinase [Terrabacter sp. 2TAF16]|uniref:sensor histidine kinase n=1 Tax=Terrabacter sp. 2TAF16 TaxID=3233008 RepID=UPI003F9B06CC
MSNRKSDYIRRGAQRRRDVRIEGGHQAPRRPGGDDAMRALCHDLIQPLATISLLADPQVLDSKERLSRIQHEVAWLTELVGSVLGDAPEDDPGLLDLRDVATYAVSCCALVTSSTVTIEAEEPVPVLASRVSLVRALICLLDNAARAAGTDGHVAVVVRTDAPWAVLRVVDDGPGLGRLVPQHSIGLVTVAAVLEECRGRLRLENGVHGGAVATVELPLLPWAEAR